MWYHAEIVIEIEYYIIENASTVDIFVLCKKYVSKAKKNNFNNNIDLRISSKNNIRTDENSILL